MFFVHPNIAKVINTTSTYTQGTNSGLVGPAPAALQAFQAGTKVAQGYQSLLATGGSGGVQGGAAGPGGGAAGASGHPGGAPPPGGSGGSAGGVPAGNQERGRQPKGATGSSSVRDNLPGPALAPGPSSGDGQSDSNMFSAALSNFRGRTVPDKSKRGGCNTCSCDSKKKK
ncbi:MAG: hypothetical protein U0931_40115 [Vulcanimicrobiota bacterium]